MFFILNLKGPQAYNVYSEAKDLLEISVTKKRKMSKNGVCFILGNNI